MKKYITICLIICFASIAMTGCKTRSDYSHSFVSDVVYMIRYLCSGMPFGGSYAAAEPYQLDMTVAELDSAIKKFLLEHPQYDVIKQEHWYYDTIHNEYEFMTGEFHSMNDNDLNDTFNGYYSYFFYLPDVQLTIMCVSPSLAKPAELWLAKISESPGYVLCLHDNQNVNVDLSRKANEAVKRKFEREVLGQLGAYRSEGYNPPYRVRARNSRFTRKFLRGMRRSGAVAPDSVSWQTVHLPTITGMDYDTLYLIKNAESEDIEKETGLSYGKDMFWSPDYYLLFLKKGNRTVYCKEFSRFPYFENVYFRFTPPRSMDEKPTCLLRTTNKNFLVRSEKLGKEVFYLLCDPSDTTLTSTAKRVWDN